MQVNLKELEIGTHEIVFDDTVATVHIRKDMGKVYQEYDWLYDQYVTKERTMAQIALDCGLSPMSINKWLVKHNIDTRPRGARAKRDEDDS
jgi:hypothetical protein